ncbi:MAG: hypothetical protein VXZ82_02065 [Planctomycetota bacterium]|nr:hypothetical protein [Planctomycetota bacterium]
MVQRDVQQSVKETRAEKPDPPRFDKGRVAESKVECDESDDQDKRRMKQVVKADPPWISAGSQPCTIRNQSPPPIDKKYNGMSGATEPIKTALAGNDSVLKTWPRST